MKNILLKFLSLVMVIALVGTMEIDVSALSPSYTPSAAYKSSVYYNNLINVTLTGNYAEDLVNVALSQVGYHEGNSESELGGGNKSGTKDYTEYGNFFGTQGSWCAMFISWCARQAQIPASVIKNTGWADADDLGVSYFSRNEHTPAPSDIIIFDWVSNGLSTKTPASSYGDHVGIVYAVDSSYVYTVEGNSDYAVKKNAYSLNDANIKGYGVYGASANYSVSSYSTTLTLAQLRAKFPNGKYWNHVGMSSNNANGYTSNPCPSHSSTSTCNAFTEGSMTGWQCYGFAMKLAYDAYGTDPYKWARGKTDLSNLKAGDIINYNGTGHTVFVIAVNGNDVTFADCNSDYHCVIRWDVHKTKSSFSNVLSVFSAPYPLDNTTTPDTCNCSTSYAGTYKVTANGALIIREGHGTNFDNIGTIPSGKEITVTKGNGTWAHTTYNGISGYVSMNYLQKVTTTTPGTDVDTRYPSGYIRAFSKDEIKAATSKNSGNLGESYVNKNEEYKIAKIYTDGWALIRYWNSSLSMYVERYTLTSSIINTSYTPKTSTIKTKSPIYRYVSGSQATNAAKEAVYANVGENCYIVGESGDYYQIIKSWSDPKDSDTAASTGYVMGWVSKSAFSCSHTYNSGVITQNATCTAQGSKLYTCTNCGETKTEAIAALGHSYTGTYWDEAHPHKVYSKCSVCGAKNYNGETHKVNGCSACYPEVTVTICSTGGTYKGSSARTIINATSLSKITLATPVKENREFMGWVPDMSSLTGVAVSSFGSPLLSDPVFCSSGKDTNIAVYDNNESGSVIIEEVSKLPDSLVTSTTKNLKITCTGGAAPGLGGYHSSHLISSKPNGVFYHVIYAKIPVGYYIQNYANAMGDGSYTEWLTRQRGTGEWEWYVYKVNCGSTGEFSSFSHVALVGEASAENPAVWYVGYNEVFDATDNANGVNDVTVGETALWLFAVWKNNKYTVTYNANGGSGSMTDSEHTYNDSSKLAKNEFTRDGYCFIGWDKDPSSRKPAYKDQQAARDVSLGEENVQLYAIWSKMADITFDELFTAGAKLSKSVNYYISYNVDFDTSFIADAILEIYDVTKGFNENSVLIKSVPLLPGEKYWIGGEYDVSAVGDYTSVIRLTLNNGVKITSYWSRFYIVDMDAIYTVAYTANGGIGAPLSQTKNKGVALTLSDIKPTRSGYTFLGWATSATATTAQYQPGGTYTADAEVTLYAVWKEDVVLPDPSEAQIVVGNVTAAPGSTVSVPIEIKNNPGFATLSIFLVSSDDSMIKIGEITNTASGLDFYDGVSRIWESSDDNSMYYADGVIGNLSVTIDKNAPEGDYTIVIADIEAVNEDFDYVTYEAVAGTIKVSSVVYGDVNGDGKVNSIDLTMLRKYLVNRNPITGQSTISVKAGADVNGDGKVTAIDLTMLRKYLVNRNPITGECPITLGPKK